MDSRVLIAAVVFAPWLGGCTTFSTPAYMKDSGGKAPGESAAPIATAAKPGANASEKSPGNKGVDLQAIEAVVAQVQEAGALEPEARQQLLEDLQKSDPALWPQIAQVFRASLVYRQQSAEAGRRGGADRVGVEPRGYPLAGAVARRPSRNKLVPTENPRDKTALEEPAVDDEDVAVENEPQAPVKKPASPKVKRPATSMVAKSTAEAEHVAPAGYVQPQEQREPEKRTWQQQLGGAITQLESELNGGSTANPADSTKQGTLHLLYLAAGRRDDAVRPIAGLPVPQQEFWSQECYGLHAFLDAEHTPDATRRAAEAATHLRQANARLGELAPLVVRNLNFCKEVQSYGVYKKFENYDFRAGQELILYAEVDNFQSQATDKGYHTALKTSYQIVDSRGAKVETQEFPLTEEHCQNPRRDFFVRYFINLPKRIYNGQYTLQITVEDEMSKKLGQSTIEFTIKEK